MTRLALFSLIIVISLTNYLYAQKRPVHKTNPPTQKVKVNKPERLYEINDFAFVIHVDKYGNSSINIQRKENVTWLTVGQVDDFFNKFRVLQNTKNPSTRSKYLDPIIVVIPDAEAEWGVVIKVMLAARVSYNSRLKVDVGNDNFLLVPGLPDNRETAYVKPNPLTLLVSIGLENQVTLNNESYGSLFDLVPLTNKLREIFVARSDNGVFRVGTNEVEKTVVIKMPLSVKFADVVRFFYALKKTGAQPIGLQIDQLEEPVIERRPLIPIQ